MDTAAYLHTRFENWQEPDENYVPHDRGGIILGVVEHCHFREARQGIILSSPANGVLLRANQIKTLDSHRPSAFDETTKAHLSEDFSIRVDSVSQDACDHSHQAPLDQRGRDLR